MNEDYTFYIENGKIKNTGFIEKPGKPFVGNSPYIMWRIDPSQRNGQPYIPLMPERMKNRPTSGTYYIGDTPVTAIYIGDTAVTALL